MKFTDGLYFTITREYRNEFINLMSTILIQHFIFIMVCVIMLWLFRIIQQYDQIFKNQNALFYALWLLYEVGIVGLTMRKKITVVNRYGSYYATRMTKVIFCHGYNDRFLYNNVYYTYLWV